jgi:hypothetical protein
MHRKSMKQKDVVEVWDVLSRSWVHLVYTVGFYIGSTLHRLHVTRFTDAEAQVTIFICFLLVSLGAVTRACPMRLPFPLEPGLHTVFVEGSVLLL